MVEECEDVASIDLGMEDGAKPKHVEREAMRKRSLIVSYYIVCVGDKDKGIVGRL